ncbi:hypothetical protein [Mucilaginibacter ginsenosidivorans]|uniref:Uncharacterized protein n=1 Tax=Mucilaginibacter ginsenosidivorans TaxID=398053 RepID=A0A5B8UWY7_9SPHI|nr:hypothetical protein [Mucilaginibacter ginsenosidivorans]QEC63677.1 hypothetical protein FRZ54_14185 [Mucilaginibacter ginsenosidivorans]
MNKILKFVMNNLLSIAVVLGVCSFIHDALLHFRNDFTLTKYSGAFIVLTAIYTRYKDYALFSGKKKKTVLNKTGVFVSLFHPFTG